MDQIPLLLPSIAHDLDGAGTVPSRLLEHGEALRHLIRIDGAGEGNAEGDAVFDALGTALALVWTGFWLVGFLR